MRKTTPSNAAVLVVISFILVILIYSSVVRFDVFARPKHIDMLCHDATPTITGAVKAEVCCQIINGNITVCNKCQYDANDNTVGSCINFYPERQVPGGTSAGLPTNALPPGNNNTGTLPPGSIIKVPPGTTSGNNIGNAMNTGNTTGTLPAQTVTKEHNPASPNTLILGGNTTNPANNTGSTGSTVQLTGQHHHKGSNVGQAETNNGNSPTPPPCPDKGPIPPNCTMKPVIK